MNLCCFELETDCQTKFPPNHEGHRSVSFTTTGLGALLKMRIARRLEAINEETNKKDNARWNKQKYTPFRFDNGDTKKQLLALSRYLLFDSPEKWSQSQKQRAIIFFSQYPDIKKVFSLTQGLRLIFSKTKEKEMACTKVARWYNKVTESDFKSFNTKSATIFRITNKYRTSLIEEAQML